MTMITRLRGASIALAVLAVAGCGDHKAATGGPAAPAATLAASLKTSHDLGTLQRVLVNAGLTGVLEGKGPYTVFAPADAAFTAAGPDAAPTDPAVRAQSAALLRALIVPGALTRADIGAAVDRGGGSGVQMRTMAGTLLTFSRDGGALVVTGDNGARARLTGEETLARNGVIQPVDALLVRPPAAAAR